MFHMMSCFSLADGITVDDFNARLDEFVTQCKDADLITAASGLGERQRHPVMDTDDRPFTHCFTLSFVDRAQCDAGVKRFFSDDYAEKETHESLFAAISEPTFFCWSD